VRSQFGLFNLDYLKETAMAKYCSEKFQEQKTGSEVIVCWRQDKHVHDASLITTIAKKLGTSKGGTWTVRSKSYQSNLSTCPINSVEYQDL
jgi:hypothetical protein